MALPIIIPLALGTLVLVGCAKAVGERCNQFFGQYTQEGETLKIGALASTKKLCPDVMEAEAVFLKKLQETRRAEATHLTLKLYDADDTQLMQLRRRDFD